MSVKRKAAKRDANEKEIVEVFEAAGCSIERVSQRGVPDLMIGHKGVNRLVEVKNPRTRARKKTDGLTDDQVEWHRTWRGKVYVVTTMEQAAALIAEWNEEVTR